MYLLNSFLSLVLLFITGLVNAQSLDQKIGELDNYIEQAREQWNVPGLSVAIVKDGKSLLLKGYGDRKLQSGEPVDTKTLFAICSTTKAMTAAAMAMLIDEGKANWDDPLVKHLPEFQLSDPYVTRAVRVRDLFTHNIGLGNADLLWYVWSYETHEIIDKMRLLDLSYPLRGGYTYQNIMYATAGVLIERLSGKSWAVFVKERVFDPLGMSCTFATKALSENYANRSIAHHYIKDDIAPIPDASADPIAAAGSIWSTIEDMQKWMLFVLDSARVDGKRLISKSNYAEWFRPQAIVSDQSFYPTQKLTKPHWKTYALGWFQHDYLGRAVSFHTGSLQGTVAIIGLIPDENLGVYVFGNLDHAEVRHAIMYKAFDVLGTKDPDRDWSTELKKLYDKRKVDRQAREKDEAEKVIPPAMSTDEFIGIYQDSFLGKTTIYRQAESLFAKFGDVEAKLHHLSLHKYGMEYVDLPWRADGSIQFLDNGREIDGLVLFGRTFRKIP